MPPTMGWFVGHPMISSQGVTTSAEACGRAVRESPSNTKRMGVSALTRYLVLQGVPVTLRAGFEGVLIGCKEGRKLAKAVNVFRCMTRTYQIAPSRKVRPSGEGVCRGDSSSLWTYAHIASFPGCSTRPGNEANANSVLVWDPD